MIVFDKLWETMEKKNISTYRLREKCGIDSKYNSEIAGKREYRDKNVG